MFNALTLEALSVTQERCKEDGLVPQVEVFAWASADPQTVSAADVAFADDIVGFGVPS